MIKRLNLKKLTFVSICYNDPGISITYKSLEPFLRSGSQHIIQNGGDSISQEEFCLSKLYEEEDTGIYNAINKAVLRVETEYFMLIHAGDTIIGKPSEIDELITNLDTTKSDLSLNNQLIGSRPHNSNLWRPWMLNFGVQPPHLPTIYRASVFQCIQYSENIPVIADFHFLRL